MAIELNLTNNTLSEQDLVDLDSRYLDGATVDLPHQTSHENRRKVIYDRLIALVEEQGLRGKFETALRPWKDGASNTVAAEQPHPGRYSNVELIINISSTSADTSPFQVAKVKVRFFATENPTPVDAAVSYGLVHPDAVDEIGRVDGHKATALRLVFNRQIRGRTSPGPLTINHYHVGGQAGQNLLFYVPAGDGPYVVMGFVDGHMDRNMAPSVRRAQDTVFGRDRSAATMKEIHGQQLRDHA